MADQDGSSIDAASLRAAEQARIRKERREAKIRAGGSARLNKITGLGGGIQPDNVPEPSPSAAPAAASEPKVHADPEEVDISQHYYEPRQTLRPAAAAAPPFPAEQQPMSQDDLRRLMLGIDPSTPQRSLGGTPAPDAAQNDPFAALMAQMLSGAGGAPSATPGGAPPSFPFPFPPQAAPQSAAPKPSSIWRIVHALFALSLGLYVALSTPFGGTLAERGVGASPSDAAPGEKNSFFWIFASAEAVLLTTRFFVDGGMSEPAGVLGTVLGFLPPHIAGYVRVAMRYGQIFTTVRSDLLVCVFVLGVASLWRSSGVAA
ncbi:uncharacterized protein DNG_08448 [Cephalotrichum gorgonifer]|uniref:Uncharacterized protein n=1 Tax=Cephalotrichum gorgonifer TaxID=2041049 RepID=A0AAE8SYC9_9PEZI|nr:uncharacterized protein DNG_08448 [Cephalotrichum gorgonifer]